MPEPPPVDRLPPPKAAPARAARSLRRAGPRAVRTVPRVVGRTRRPAASAPAATPEPEAVPSDSPIPPQAKR